MDVLLAGKESTVPTQIRARRSEQNRKAAPAEAEAVSKRPEILDSAILDEIDGLLEENAEEFVRNYVQKGGQ